MQHTFYLPIGLPVLASHPPDPETGQAYYNSTQQQMVVWSGTDWIPVAQPTQVIAGGGLTGGQNPDGSATLNVGAGRGIAVFNDSVDTRLTVDGGLSYEITDNNSLRVNSVWLDQKITAKVPTDYVKRSGDTMTGPLSVPVGTNASHAVNLGQLNSMSGFVVGSGAGLYGGAAIGNNPTLNVGAGDGIAVGTDSVAVNWTRLNGVYSGVNHGHGATDVGFRFGRFGAGSIPGSDYITKTIAHGLGRTPTIALGTAYADTGIQSAVVSVDKMDAANVTFKIRNLNTKQSDIFDVSWLVA